MQQTLKLTKILAPVCRHFHPTMEGPGSLRPAHRSPLHGRAQLMAVRIGQQPQMQVKTIADALEIHPFIL
jgi:hypothetical protein